jgi:esterase/lipase superfamily enzyme
MRPHQSACSALAFLFALVMGFGTGNARPVIDAEVALRICGAFSKKAPQRMPAIVSPKAAQKLLEQYGPYFEELDGCLSAAEIEHGAQTATFLIQNIRYESSWRFSTDNTSIQAIHIQFRPVTLAGDEEWQDPLHTPDTTVGHDAVDQSKPISQSDASSATPPSSLPASDPNIVEFFYATNRKELVYRPGYSPDGWTPVTGGYTGERNENLTFGAVSVRVPEGHHIGRIELPSDLRVFGFTFQTETVDPTKHFTIRSVEKTPEDVWIKSLSASKRKKALIFVHGFNTNFQDSIFRTAQIVWDLRFEGTTVLFSWPSRGEIADYFYDKDSALGSRDALLHVVDDLHKAGFKDIDVIAHSMGNLIAVDALSNGASTQSPAKIAQFVMAAPDVDRDMFLQEIPKLAKVAKGLTLYASANDKALQLSKRVAGGIPRAGDVPPSGPVVIASLATIDVSAIGDELFGLNHNAFATTRNVLNDLKILLETGAPPPRLTEIRGYPEPPQKAIYFRYVP